jgi:hypothetical protein
MHSTIFWPRLSATLTSDARRTIDRDWASADALIHSVAVFVLVGVAYIVVGVSSKLIGAFGLLFVLESDDIQSVAIWGGLFLVLLSYVPYHLALGPQRRNGTVFRSIFDVYRQNMKAISLPEADEWKQWDQLGDRLLYTRSPRSPDRKSE